MDKTVKLKIEGMHCGSCEKIIEMELLDVPGFKSAKINSQTGEGEVVFDQNVDDGQITAAIIRAGYKGEIIKEEKEAQAEDQQNDIVIEKKIVDADSPFKIRLESSIVADGEFSQMTINLFLKGRSIKQKKANLRFLKAEMILKMLFKIFSIHPK